MPTVQFTGDSRPWLRILSGTGELIESCSPNTPGARARDWEIPATKEKGTAYEILHDGWSGVIESIEFKESEYGEVCVIHLEDAHISIKYNTPGEGPYFVDFAKKIRSADLAKPITFRPFAFLPEGAKRKLKGISMTQGDKKLQNYYYDHATKTAIDGFPIPNEEEAATKKNYWKFQYFPLVTEFLVAELAKLKTTQTLKSKSTLEPLPEEFDLDPSNNLPF